jgi:hypothetical protein
LTVPRLSPLFVCLVFSKSIQRCRPV